MGIEQQEGTRQGSIEHRYWRKRIAEHYRAQGYQVLEETPIGGGKTVDIVARKDGKTIAIEIETGKSDALGNIRKCLKAGLGEVVSAATRAEVKRALEERVRGARMDARAVKVASAQELLQTKSS